MAARTINVAEFLYLRLLQLGCKSLHGLPGDFNLLALDFVQPSGLRWVGNCNELNAGYAADAYGRVTGLGALMTTFGVGELSAVNAIAGAYAELAPVVHIVGTPPRKAQSEHLFLHHTLGNGDYHLYARIYKEITIAQADLVDIKTAPSEIDRVLRRCFLESRPVYIQLPTDIVTQKIDITLLDTPIDLVPDSHDEPAEDKALNLILQRIYTAKAPAVIVDGAVSKRRIVNEVDKLVRKLQLPVFVCPMGKGCVDEQLPFYFGLYAGAESDPAVKAELEKSDLIVTIGNIQSDLNTAGFTAKFPVDSTIALHNAYVAIGAEKIPGVPFKSLIPKLTDAVDPTKLLAIAREPPKKVALSSAASHDEQITHAWLWPRLTDWFQEDDIIVTDTGTSYVGYWGSGLRRGTQIINQILWSSIGYGIGAVQGAGLAAQEDARGRRTICFEGDGSFQLTAQELSTIIRHNLDVTIFLIENEGYTIERFVHGLEASYNDVAQWQYSAVPRVFAQNFQQSKIKTWKLRTRQELDRLLNDRDFSNGKGLQFVELHMPKLDAPQVLIEFGKNAAERAS